MPSPFTRPEQIFVSIFGDFSRISRTTHPEKKNAISGLQLQYVCSLLSELDREPLNRY
jgi:hypothetical protein